MRKFLETTVPGSIESSTSTNTMFASRTRRYQPLFTGYYEIRTIYFQSTMTVEQKKSLGSSMHLRKFANVVNITQDPRHIGVSPWCWLPGLRTFEGKTTVAATILFKWKTPELERIYQENERRPGNQSQPSRRIVDVFEEELQAMGKVGAVSQHCIFCSGPWYN